MSRSGGSGAVAVRLPAVILAVAVTVTMTLPGPVTAAGQGEADGPAADAALGADCEESSLSAYAALPDLVYADLPDSLLDLVNAWDRSCGHREEIVRIRILGSIWDGGFDEGLYDGRIIDDLLEFENAAAGAGTADPAFAAFTASFADQLLPHVPAGSPQEFFCLFYARQTDAAWAMLRGDALAGTDLRRYYDRAVGELDGGGEAFAAASAGFWNPFGKYAFAGDHPLVGLQYGLQGRSWFLRAVGEVRPGRTTRPYRVDQDGLQGDSDRFDALQVGFEVGRSLGGFAGHRANAFLGAGLDVVRPFGAEDVLLQASLLCAGAGYRFEPGRGRPWFLSLDYRREWIGARNERATHLFGDAWSLRAGLGWIFGAQDRDRLRRLQG